MTDSRQPEGSTGSEPTKAEPTKAEPANTEPAALGPTAHDVAGEPAEEAGPVTTLSTMAGRPILVVDAVGTALLVLTVVVASAWSTSATELAFLVVSLVLFFAGSAAFVVGFLIAVGRSRTEVVDMAGLFYLTGTAPRVVRRAMLGLWFVQIGVVAVSLALAPAFGVMAVVWGIGLLPLWGARHGRFPKRPASGRPGRRSGPQ